MKVTRRTFSGGITASFLGPIGTRLAFAQEPRQASSPVDALFDRAVVVDALTNEDKWTEETWGAFRKSGITIAHASLDNGSLSAALRDLAEWQARFDRNPERLQKVLTAVDFMGAKKAGRLGVILGFQNATMIETDLRNLDTLYHLGTRCIQLTYNSRNLLGDGCTERTNAGLSDFGVSVVERMNVMGMAVDLSHCGEQTSRDAIALTKAPPSFTHTMCRSVYDHVRAKGDDLLKSMADKGGVVGIVQLGYFVGPTSGTSLDDYLRHIDHAVRVAGIDHVGLSSDFSVRGIEATATRESWYVRRLTSFKPSYRVRWPPWIKELDPPERNRTIAHALSKRGYAERQIEKVLGGNWVRYFSDVLKA